MFVVLSCVWVCVFPVGLWLCEFGVRVDELQLVCSFVVRVCCCSLVHDSLGCLTISLYVLALC
jgi:hypothetical protein